MPLIREVTYYQHTIETYRQLVVSAQCSPSNGDIETNLIATASSDTYPSALSNSGASAQGFGIRDSIPPPRPGCGAGVVSS